jgi:methylenetetrahydrofolate reductase (NADPH)
MAEAAAAEPHVSHLRNKLQAGGFAITAEVTPPLSADANDLFKKALPLKGWVDAVNVTDGASAKSHMDATIAAALLLQNGVEPILQLTCRDRNRIALQSQLVGAAAMGIVNILTLTGDDPKQGDQPEAKAVFDLTSAGLIQTAVSIRDKGELLHGRKVGGKADFFIGGADAPVDPKPDWQPKSLKAKIEAGAQFAQTQFCMDLGVVRRYVDRLADEGLLENFHILIGIAPLASARSAHWMRDNLFGTIIPDEIVARMEGAADPKEEGRQIAAELLIGLSQIKGVSGAHIMAPLNEASIPAVVDAFRKN